MNDIQYNEMVAMLTKATKTRKLFWSLDEETGEYSARLGDCQVGISSNIDFQMQAEAVTLVLINADGNQFDSISGNSAIDEDKYNQLNQLYEEVRNSYFRIRESESMIMNKLKELTTEVSAPQSTHVDDDDLPF